MKCIWFALCATIILAIASQRQQLEANAAGSSSQPYNQQQQQQQQQQQEQDQRTHFKLPILFDFDSYKRLHRKHYSSHVEEQVRRKLFTARAQRTFIAAIKYRHRQANFYLAINHMSDMSRAELLRNRGLEGRAFGKEEKEGQQEARGDLIADFKDSKRIMLDGEHTGEFGHLAQVRSRMLVPNKRSRRDTIARRERTLRELSQEKLVQMPPPESDDSYASLPDETRAKIRQRPPSDNPFYEGAELPTGGLIDQQRALEAVAIIQQDETNDMAKQRAPVNISQIYRDDHEGRDLPDAVFLDWRAKSSCLFAPRNQGSCGACYAFAGVTVAEWLHCMVTGELVAFSEQYIIDCGAAYTNGDLAGCTQGRVDRLISFFQNFGWELRANYPYRMRQEQCPYEENTDLRTVGYIRGELRKEVQFKMNVWAHTLEQYGPIIVQINTLAGPFDEYGGGVYDSCEPKRPDHSVVVIGHGREDGQEYWLVRNSYSVGWGEAGHLKLSKRADCIWPHWGWSFGTEDGLRRTMTVGKNENYARGPIEARRSDTCRIRKTPPTKVLTRANPLRV